MIEQEEFLNYVKNYNGSLEDLAKEIGAMSYDAVSEFLGYLADDLKRQQGIDKSMGRKKLVNAEEEFLDSLYTAKEKMDKVWQICKPYSVIHSKDENQG